MTETFQAATTHLSSASKTTLRLVVAYHFLVAAVLGGAIILAWLDVRSAPEDINIAEVMSGVAATLVVLYSVVGWGILKWKHWSRVASIFLNWINVVGGVVSVARLRVSPEGVISSLLSCLVLWWLSVPAVKLEFQRQSEAR